MKKTQITKIICALIWLLATTGCNAESEGDNSSNEEGEHGITIARVGTYEKLEISDWMDSDTVIVSKENESLGKMRLEELSDSYPRSLYLYQLDTKEYKLLKEEADLNLGGAKLSPDRKNLLYHGSSLGDLSYYVLNLENLKSFSISGEPIGSAGSAGWADNDTVIGAGYTSGAYYASTEGKITTLKELDLQNVFIVKKLKDTIYYNTADDNTLMALDLSTKKAVSLDLPNVFALYSSPDENQILVLQYKGAKQILSLCDRDGSNVKIITEGVELGGVSWSPDQRMIAYSMKGDESDTAVSGLYLYDMLTGKSVRIAADLSNAATCWSPSGQELVYTQWDGKQYNSSIVYLEYSLNP